MFFLKKTGILFLKNMFFLLCITIYNHKLAGLSFLPLNSSKLINYRVGNCELGCRYRQANTWHCSDVTVALMSQLLWRHSCCIASVKFYKKCYYLLWMFTMLPALINYSKGQFKFNSELDSCHWQVTPWPLQWCHSSCD